MSYKRNLSFLVSGSLIVAAVACGHKVDKAKNDKAASANNKPTVTDPNKPGDPKAPVEAKAGQPGQIILTLGALNAEKNAAHEALEIIFNTGKDKDGKGTVLKDMKPQLVPALNTADEKTLKEVKDLKTFSKIGCSDDQLKNVTLTDLKEEAVADVQEDGMLFVRANVVAICGALPNAKTVLINADTLLLSDAKASIVAVGNNESITLRANRLVVSGLNEIAATEGDSNVPSTNAGLRIALTVGESIQSLKESNLALIATGSSVPKSAKQEAPKSLLDLQPTDL